MTYSFKHCPGIPNPFLAANSKCAQICSAQEILLGIPFSTSQRTWESHYGTSKIVLVSPCKSHKGNLKTARRRNLVICPMTTAASLPTVLPIFLIFSNLVHKTTSAQRGMADSSTALSIFKSDL